MKHLLSSLKFVTCCVLCLRFFYFSICLLSSSAPRLFYVCEEVELGVATARCSVWSCLGEL